MALFNLFAIVVAVLVIVIGAVALLSLMVIDQVREEKKNV